MLLITPQGTDSFVGFFFGGGGGGEGGRRGEGALKRGNQLREFDMCEEKDVD